jgi:hypothetical protein
MKELILFGFAVALLGIAYQLGHALGVKQGYKEGVEDGRIGYRREG